jgi:hypothetical protein
MGLLDDAIREHLELKRLRGADPGEVAREQREALAAVPREGESAALPLESDAREPAAGQNGEGGLTDADVGPPAEPHTPARPITGGEPVRAPQPPEHGVQETAELDMSALLNGEMDDAGEGERTPEPVAVRERENQQDEDPAESSPEWETRGDAPEGSRRGGKHRREGRVPGEE